MHVARIREPWSKWQSILESWEDVMKTTTSKSILAAILTAALALAGNAQAAVRYVASNGSGAGGQSWATAYPTIQQAVADVSIGGGDEIWVKQGVYTIPTAIRLTKALKIYGGFSGDGSTRDPAAYVTTLTIGPDGKRPFNVYAAATIDGFTFTGGYTWGIPPNSGGALYIEATAATVANCIFYDNYSDFDGGALAAVWAHGTTISDCVFTQNSCDGYGGAIYSYDSNLTITGCTFTDNVANQTLDGLGDEDPLPGGGAIFNEYGQPIISDCVLTGNDAYYGGGINNYFADAYIYGCTIANCGSSVASGGGLFNYGNSAVVSECLFKGNDVDLFGGGVFDTSTSKYINCIFWNNSASWQGGGLYVQRSASDTFSRPVLTNCTFYGNDADKGGGMYTDNTIATATNCIFWGNSATSDSDGPGIYDAKTIWQGAGTVATYCDIEGATTFSGEGNLRVNPQFSNPSAGDFELLYGSPCIDTGTNSAPDLATMDFEGKPRVANGDGDSQAVVDMGALEYRGRYVADNLLSARIFQTDEYDGPSDAVSTGIFEIELETSPDVSYVQFLTPGGRTYTIFTTPSSGDGGQTTYRIVDGVQVWGYRGVTGPTNPMVNYGNGTYTIMLHYPAADSQQTNLWYGVPNSSASLVMPNQKPNVTSPAYDGPAISPVTLAWGACTDTYVNHISVKVFGSNDDTVATDLVAVSQTNSAELSLDEGHYSAEIAFENSYSVTTSDSIPFKYGKAVSVEYEFEVILNTMYRFWAPGLLRHFFTISATERDYVRATWPDAWSYEGPVFHAYATPYVDGLVPVYRYWSSILTSHFYTINDDERAYIDATYTEEQWASEGIVFYAFPPGSWVPADAKPVYRFWNEVTSTHFYTISESEKDYVLAHWPQYIFEGIAFYAFD